MSGPLKHDSLQGHSSYVHTEQSFAFSHPSARGADVGSSSWAPHPWLDLAQPAGSEATWHPGWPSKQASPVARLCPGLSLFLQLCAAIWDVYFNPATSNVCMHTASPCCNLYFEGVLGECSAAFAQVNFHKSLRLIQLLQHREGGITLQSDTHGRGHGFGLERLVWRAQRFIVISALPPSASVSSLFLCRMSPGSINGG